MAGIKLNVPETRQIAGSSESVRQPIRVAQGDHAFTTPEEQSQTNVFPLPDAVAVNVTSAAGAGALATTVFVFNQDYLTSVLNNGSGAGSITYSFSDSFNGNVISRLLGYSRSGVGAIFYGVAIRMTVASTGADLPSAFTTINPYFLTYNAYGKQVGIQNLDTSTNQTRKDTDKAIQVSRFNVNVSRMSQFAMTMPVNSTASLTFYTKPNFSV